MTITKGKIDQNKVCNDRMYEEVAQELGYPIERVKEVFKCQGELTRRAMRRGGFEGVKWMYLGKIVANFRKVQMMSNNNRSKV